MTAEFDRQRAQPSTTKAGRTRRAPRRAPAARARAKFLRFYPGGFRDAEYVALERDYKWHAHEAWEAVLGRAAFRGLVRQRRFDEVTAHAVRIESRTNLLFSFEKMALRDAVRTPAAQRDFAEAFYDWVYGRGAAPARFATWIAVLDALPRRQTRVVTWPVHRVDLIS